MDNQNHQTRVVNRYKDKFDIDIGRLQGKKHHYGNPFSHLGSSSLAIIKVCSRNYAIDAFRNWLSETDYLDVEPERRDWILANLGFLKNKTLGCYCKPKSCHGDVLIEFIEKMEL